MRFASADRRSTATWLWSALGVLAWLVLTSLLNSAPASASDRHGGDHAPRTASSAAQHASHAKPGKSDARPAEAEADRADRGPKHRSEPTQHSDQKRSDQRRDSGKKNHTPPVAPAQKTTQPSATSTSTAMSNEKSSVKRKTDETHRKSPQNRQPWTARPSAHAHDRDHAHAHARSDHHSDRHDSRPGFNHRGEPRERGTWHGKGHGHAFGHHKHHTHHKDHAQHRPARDAREVTPSAVAPAAASDWHDLVPAPAPSATVSNGTASASPTPDDRTPSYEPLHGNTPGIDPMSAPATSGAGTGGAAPLQLTGEAVADAATPSTLLLGVHTHADERPPTGPSDSTDSSPD